MKKEIHNYTIKNILKNCRIKIYQLFTFIFISFLSFQIQGQTTYKFADVGVDHSSDNTGTSGFKSITTDPIGAPLIVANIMQHHTTYQALTPVSVPVDGVLDFIIKGDGYSFDLYDMMWASLNNEALLINSSINFIRDGEPDVLWTLTNTEQLHKETPTSIFDIFGKTLGVDTVTNVFSIQIILEYASTNNSDDFGVLSITLDNPVVLNVDLNKLNDITTIYPNPTSGVVQIKLDEVYESINVNVNNILGQTVKSFVKESVSIIDFEIPGDSGIYFVEILTERGGRALYKVLKK